MKLFVCNTCHLGRAGFAETLRQAMPAGVEVLEIECMSRPAPAIKRIAFRAPGKTAYLFGDITLSDLDQLQNFAHHYAQSPDGSFADARILGDLRTKAIARIPA